MRIATGASMVGKHWMLGLLIYWEKSYNAAVSTKVVI
jgi:hypothetical protein